MKLYRLGLQHEDWHCDDHMPGLQCLTWQTACTHQAKTRSQLWHTQLPKLWMSLASTACMVLQAKKHALCSSLLRQLDSCPLAQRERRTHDDKSHQMAHAKLRHSWNAPLYGPATWYGFSPPGPVADAPLCWTGTCPVPDMCLLCSTCAPSLVLTDDALDLGHGQAWHI